MKNLLILFEKNFIMRNIHNINIHIKLFLLYFIDYAKNKRKILFVGKLTKLYKKYM